MIEECLLYDILARDYPMSLGEVFRTRQVFECWVCGALSNAAVASHVPYQAIQVFCPQSQECWHHDLENLLIQETKSSTPEEMGSLKKAIQFIKDRHCGVSLDDIKGSPDLIDRHPVTSVRSIRFGYFCKHQ